MAATVVAGCGSGAASGSDKRLGDRGPCDLVTPAELEDLVGARYGSGEAEGPQCSFSPVETLGSPHVTIGAGISLTADTANVELSDTEVRGIAATAMRTKPRGTSCMVEVALVPSDEAQTFNADVGGVTDGAPCRLAERVAGHILDTLPG
ncbi:Protein of unknown function (DUF3558) [Prauserella halophila]|nr:Protein of unknown function (DUF3558) [Prauserella halophila]